MSVSYSTIEFEQYKPTTSLKRAIDTEIGSRVEIPCLGDKGGCLEQCRSHFLSSQKTQEVVFSRDC